MKVKLKYTFFAPTEKRQLDKLRSSSGRRYRGGRIHEMPEWMRSHLPKDAIILDDLPPEPEVEEVDPTAEARAADPLRIASEAQAKAFEEAEERERSRVHPSDDDLSARAEAVLAATAKANRQAGARRAQEAKRLKAEERKRAAK